MIERPLCSKCDVEMWIDYEEDHPEDEQLKIVNFGCATCDSSVNITVDRDAQVDPPA